MLSLVAFLNLIFRWLCHNHIFFIFGRSTVLSSTIPPSMQPFKISRTAESNSLSQSKGLRPPPRAPAAKPGRSIGPVQCNNGRSTKDNYDARIFYQNTVPQSISPHPFQRVVQAQQIYKDNSQGNINSHHRSVACHPDQLSILIPIHTTSRPRMIF